MDALPGDANFNHLQVDNQSYFFNLSLRYRTVVDFFQLKSKAAFRNWIFEIFRNTMTDFLRKAKRQSKSHFNFKLASTS